MDAIATSAAVFVCVAAGALGGLLLAATLPQNHLSEDSKDVIKLVSALISTLSAMVLGLLIASAQSSFNEMDDALRQMAAKVVLLDRTLAEYGPEANDVRGLLRKTFASRVDALSSNAAAAMQTPTGTSAIEGVEKAVRTLTPHGDAQQALFSRATQIVDDVVQMRWIAVERTSGSLPTSLLVVLTFWLAAMFASFALFAPRNATSVVVLFLGALSVAMSIFMIEEMNRPLDGVVRVSDAPMQEALARLGK